MVIWLYGHNYVKGGALPAAVCAAAAWNSATATSQGWAQSNTSIYGYMTKKYFNYLVNCAVGNRAVPVQPGTARLPPAKAGHIE